MENKHHILIIDDDSRILQLLKKFLIKQGYLVTTTENPEDVMQLIAQFSFDLIVLDVMMPKITGMDLSIEIKKISPNIPIIMLTALSSTDDVIKGLESGANDYIRKPFEAKELLLRIQNLIKLHQLQKNDQDVIQFGANFYNKISKTLTRNAQQISLSNADIKLLDILIKSLNKPISRNHLSKTLELNIRSIDVQIVRLRSKIEDNPKSPSHLKTIRNQGYALYS